MPVTLHWMMGDSIVDEGTYTPGKAIYLESHGAANTPNAWQIYQVFDSAIRQILRHIGIPERRLGPELNQITYVPPSVYRSANSWQLPTPRGWRKSAAYIFTDSERDEQSRPVYSSRVGRAKLGAGGNAGLTDPTGALPIGMGGSASLESEMLFAADPELSVSVITGEELGHHMMRNLEEIFLTSDEAGVAARIDLARDDLAAIAHHAYAPPLNWTVSPATNSVSGDSGDISRITVDLEMSSPGQGYYAISYDDPRGDAYSETTDAWAVNVDVNGNVTVLRDVSNISFRIPAYA
jgi:hypothetical protein